MTAVESVWVIGDAGEGRGLGNAVVEALTPAEMLRRAWGGNIRVMLFASHEVSKEEISILHRCGASRVTILHHHDMAASADDVRVAAMDAALAIGRPRVLLVASPHRYTWAVRLATRRRRPIITGCLELVPSGVGVRVRREVCGGAAHMSVEVSLVDDCSPGVFVLEPDSWSLPTPITGRDGREFADTVEVIEIEASPGPPGVEVLGRVSPIGDDLSLDDAELILAGGAGLGSRAGFDELRDAARALGAAVGATRVAVDQGWARAEEQIGLTGHRVTPRVYLAFGVSGAREHLTGLPGIQNLVAINTDRSAPIAGVSRLFAVADARDIVKALRAEADKRALSALGAAKDSGSDRRR
jgi:electron transfer flavoprotein alpha subunit